MNLTKKQQFIFNLLTKRVGEYVAPHELGKSYRRSTGSDCSWYDTSDYSAVASPVCKALVAKGLVSRNHKGHYKVPSAGTSNAIAGNELSKSARATNTNIPEQSNMSTDPDAARLAYNKAHGFIRIAVLSNGKEVYKKKNTDGTWAYYSQRGQVFSQVWNSMYATEEEFLAIAKDCYKIGEVIVTDIEKAPSAKYKIGTLIFYLKDRQVHSAKVLHIMPTENGFQYQTVHGIIKEDSVYPSRDALVANL